MLPAMRMGGAEKIAINFLKELSKFFDVTVCLNKKEGELLESLPDGIRCIEDPIYSFQKVVSWDLKKLSVLSLIKDFGYYLKVKFKCDSEKDYRYLVSRTPPIEKKYDVAIAYVGNVSTQIFSLADRINADKKIAWIHGETNELRDSALFEGLYSDFDKVYCVSEISRQHFVEKYPSCVHITDVYYNPIDSADIISKSKLSTSLPYSSEYTNILSVGRISPEKGFGMIPGILSILIEKGYKVRWYIVGDGPEREKIGKESKQTGTEEALLFLGTKNNPYPYIAGCDLYVQPSYEEGYSTTICEAGILGKAIVGTRTSGGIYEQVEEGISAILAEPTPDSLAGAIEKVISDSSLRDELQKQIKKKDFSHPNEIQKILSFFESDG